ncbi:hypothetical protein JW992_03085, partial [candidate division KSB1 bacterium]|nr:hypothetical protein [candidate division KSB1 bacterium]
GYRIHYGVEKGRYTQKIDVGQVTEHQLHDLEQNVTYFFSLTAYDKTGNESPHSTDVSFVLGDSDPPQIASVTPLSLTEIQVRFSEAVETASATAVGNYRIANGPAILEAVLQNDQRTVHLRTESHQSDRDYTLGVENVRDRALDPNTIASGTTVAYSFKSDSKDTTPPTVVLATLTAATELRIYFNEPLSQTTAVNSSNYSIQPDIQVLSAELGEGGTAVVLRTTEHHVGVSYTLTVNNVTDRAEPGNPIAVNSRYVYAYDPGDVIGPMISLVTLPDAEQVEILFNETLDRASAETVANYTIDNGVTVREAVLDASGQIVSLATRPHQPDQAYALTVNNIRDNSPNLNPISPDTRYAYVYAELDRTGPTIVRTDVLDQTHLRVLYSEPVEKSSAERTRNYTIDNGMQVLDASLDLGGKSVTLLTSPHSAGMTYTLTISQVLDLSPVGNEILPNSSYSYIYQPQSGQSGPTLVQVEVQNVSTLILEFSIPVAKQSAENPSHYQINRGVTVYSAELDEGGARVRLETAPHEPNNIYLLSVDNVTDNSSAQNPIAPYTLYAYHVQSPDHVGPLITMVQVVDAHHVDILFNERISPDEAEKISNYVISGDIQVREARLAGSKRVVHLTTSAHSPHRLYLLRLSGLVDESAAQNPVAPNTSYAYLYEPQDEIPPTIAMVQPLDATHVQVAFSETIDPSSLVTADQFILNNDTRVLSIRLMQNHLVELETTPLYSDRVYVLLASGIRDEMQNEIASNSSYTFTFGTFQLNTGPKMMAVISQSQTELKVMWDLSLDKNSAERAENYQIQGGVRVISAILDSSRTTVYLTTSEHETQKIYVLLASHIGRADQPAVQTPPNSPYFYMVWQENASAPTVRRVDVLGERLIQVTFDKAVDRLSALNRKNFSISNDMTILNAELDHTRKVVTLETSRHKAGIVYTLTATGIRSESASLQVNFASSAAAYTYLPNLQVTVEGGVETGMGYLDAGRVYYIDRNYVLTKVPERFNNVRMIMTSNNDRGNTQSRYMTLKLTQPAFIYIAYDSRAESVPNWLDARFRKTTYKLGVSDNAKELDLWQGYFENGVVSLGGNNAPGARGSYSMYIVLLEEPDLSQLPEGGSLEGYWGNGAIVPETPELKHNYPNPFNPTTTIPFSLPYDMTVVLEIYNVLGQRVRSLVDHLLPGGQHQIVWDGRSNDGLPVAAGLYFYRLQVWEKTERNGMSVKENYLVLTRKMLLLK